jgi:branched-subunit amino acid transport protein AzlD
MKIDLLTTVLLIAVGTYLIRAVPFVLSSKKKTEMKSRSQINLFFQLMGPSMIAALLVVSIESPLETHDYTDFINTCIGFAGVGAYHHLWQNSGVSVLAGVTFFSASLLYFSS